MKTIFLAIMDQLGQRGDSVCSAEGLVGWWSLIGRGLLLWDLLVKLWGMMTAVRAFLNVFRYILLHLVLSELWLLAGSDLPCGYLRLTDLGLLFELFLLSLLNKISAASSSSAIQLILATLWLHIRHHSCLSHGLRTVNHGIRTLALANGEGPP